VKFFPLPLFPHVTVVCKIKMKFRDVLEIIQQIMVLVKATGAKSWCCQVEMKRKNVCNWELSSKMLAFQKENLEYLFI